MHSNTVYAKNRLMLMSYSVDRREGKILSGRAKLKFISWASKFHIENWKESGKFFNLFMKYPLI